ncbi:uncharacterized protein LOC134279413 [Saccostrea cucullata]|uniref:uncharacterized protein LOC134279413 n=1 Tax=Saccostrea cuccullata TaxID=36930 RepID=UPI002ED37270
MDQYKTSEETMNSHTCIFDTKEQLPLPDFHRKYKSKFPLIAIVVGGHYGPTQWDDLSSDLVMRIEREFKQQRVLAKNPISYKKQYISIPVNGRYKFNVVKSFMRHSKDQSMADILKQYNLPVFVQFSERQEVPTEGKGGPDGKPINLLIEHRHEEIYLQGNYFFEGCITKESVSVMLSPFITMAPVHGLMTMTEENYDQYLQRMTDYVKENSKFSEDSCNLGIKVLEESDPEIAHIIPNKPAIDSGLAPELPKRGPRRRSKLSAISSRIRRFEVGIIPKTQDLQNSHDSEATQSVKEGERNKSEDGKSTKPNVKPKPVVTKRISTNEKDVYDEIVECSELPTQIVQPKKVNGYVNDNFCPVQPIPITQKTGDQNDYEEYMFMSTPKSNRGHVEIISHERRYDQKTAKLQTPQPEYDYFSRSIGREHPEDAYAGFTLVQDNIQTPKESEYVSRKTIKELGEILIKLKLEKYVEKFAENMVDGEIVQELSAADLKNEFEFTRAEALRLRKYIEKGHIPV